MMIFLHQLKINCHMRYAYTLQTRGEYFVWQIAHATLMNPLQFAEVIIFKMKVNLVFYFTEKFNVFAIMWRLGSG